jgi:hypothetical protein
MTSGVKFIKCDIRASVCAINRVNVHIMSSCPITIEQSETAAGRVKKGSSKYFAGQWAKRFGRWAIALEWPFFNLLYFWDCSIFDERLSQNEISSTASAYSLHTEPTIILSKAYSSEFFREVIALQKLTSLVPSSSWQPFHLFMYRYAFNCHLQYWILYERIISILKLKVCIDSYVLYVHHFNHACFDAGSGVHSFRRHKRELSPNCTSRHNLTSIYLYTLFVMVNSIYGNDLSYIFDCKPFESPKIKPWQQ